MSFDLKSIVEGAIHERQGASFYHRIPNQEAHLESYKYETLKYLSMHCCHGNPGNIQVVETFLNQYSTSSFNYLHLSTNTPSQKTYEIQFTKKPNELNGENPAVLLNLDNLEKKVKKTSISHLTFQPMFSSSKAFLRFSPQDAVSRVYSYSMAEQSHDPMLKAFFNSGYTSVSSYHGGCENRYELTDEKEGTTARVTPPPGRVQIWSIK